jgi:hypothetical protein
MRTLATALLSTVVILGGVAARAAAEPSFVGIWFSAGQPDEPGVMSVIEFLPDGTFREEFRKCENGQITGFQFQSGTWSVENGVEHTLSTMINGEASNVADTYQVELLTDAQRRIRMTAGDKDYVFASVRVSKFEFPDCASGV